MHFETIENQFNPLKIRQNAEKFRKDVFKTKFQSYIENNII